MPLSPSPAHATRGWTPGRGDQLIDELSFHLWLPAAFLVSGFRSLSVARLRWAGQLQQNTLEGSQELVTLSGSLRPGGAHLHAVLAQARPRQWLPGAVAAALNWAAAARGCESGGIVVAQQRLPLSDPTLDCRATGRLSAPVPGHLSRAC